MSRIKGFTQEWLDKREKSQVKPVSKSKYRNKKVEYEGQKFDSIKEWKRWLVLCDMQNKGEIKNLSRQVTYLITHGKVAICKYIADHQYEKDGKVIVEDVKSEMTKRLPVYRLKKKLMLAFFSIDVQEV